MGIHQFVNGESVKRKRDLNCVSFGVEPKLLGHMVKVKNFKLITDTKLGINIKRLIMSPVYISLLSAFTGAFSAFALYFIRDFVTRFLREKATLVKTKYLLDIRYKDVAQMQEWHKKFKKDPSNLFAGRLRSASVSYEMQEALSYGIYFSADLNVASGLDLDISELLFLLRKSPQILNTILLARMQYYEIHHLIKDRNEIMFKIREAVGHSDFDHIMNKETDILPPLTNQLLKTITNTKEDTLKATKEVQAKLDCKYKHIISYCCFWL